MGFDTETMEESRKLTADTARAPVDHVLLVAAIAVRQAGTRTARIAGRIAVRQAAQEPLHALVATLLHADHAAAARTLHGSFHPGVASRTQLLTVKSGLTLGF